MSNRHYVFVYGTLLSGEGNHRRFLSTNKEKIYKNTFIRGKLYTLGGFPGARDVGISAHEYIKGEMYIVDDKTLQELDRLEGYRGPDSMSTNMYNRIETRVYDRYGITIVKYANVYEYNKELPESQRIMSNDWRNRNSKELTPFPMYDDDNDENYDE